MKSWTDWNAEEFADWLNFAGACRGSRARYARMTAVEGLKVATTEDRFWVAQNANCPAEVLTALSTDGDAGVRYCVARNANCPAEVLTALSTDGDASVRYGVARNANCPAEVLTALSTDGDAGVRYWVTQNANCPADLKKGLSHFL